MAEEQADDLRHESHHHAAEQEPDACVPQSREKDRASMEPGEPDESRQSQRCHKRDGAIGNSPEQRIMRAQMTDQKASKQRSDTRAQRDLDASDRKGQQNANDAAEKNRK